MARGNKQAVASLFDFIFANNKQQGKLRPTEATGFSTTDAVAGAMAQVVSAPAVLAGEQAMNLADDTLFDQQKLVEFKFDQDPRRAARYGKFDPNESRFRIRLRDLPSVVKDPNKFVSGIYQKTAAQRKWSAYAKPWAAEKVDYVNSMGYAYKNGANASEAEKFGLSANIVVDEATHRANRELLAENAVIESQIEQAKIDVQRRIDSGQLPADADYAQEVRMYLSNETNVAIRDKYVNDIVGSLNRSKLLQGADFLENINRNEEAINVRKRELVAQLQQSGNYSEASARSVVDNFFRELDKNFDVGATRYRMNYVRNANLKSVIASDQAVADRYHKLANAALIWQRNRADEDFVFNIDSDGSKSDKKGSGVNTTLRQINREIAQLRRDGGDAAYIARLEEIKGSMQKSLATGRGRSRSVITLGGGGRGPNRNERVAQLQSQLDYDIARLDYKHNQELNSANPNQFDIQKWFRQKNELENIRNGITPDSLGRTGSRARVALQQYESVRGLYTAATTPIEGWQLASGLWFAKSISENPLAPGEIGGYTRSYKTFTRGEGEKNALGIDSWGDNGRLEYNDDGSVKQDHAGNHYRGYILRRRDLQTSPLAQSYSKLSALRYLAPTALAKSLLWNGEVFGYLADSRSLDLENHLARGDATLAAYLLNLHGNNPGLLNDYELGSIIDGDEVNWGLLHKNPHKLAALLKDESEAGRLDGAIGSYAKRFYRKYDSILRNASISRWYTNINSRYSAYFNRFRGAVMKYTGIGGALDVAREKYVMKFLQRYFKGDDAYQAMVAGFAGGKVGLRGMTRQFIITALKASPIGRITILLNFVADGLADRLVQATQPFIQLAVTALVGFILLFCFGTLVILDNTVFRWSRPRTVEYAYQVPGEAVMCIGSGDVDLGEPGQPPTGTGSVPPGSICPINQGAVCTQGPNGRWSHAALPSHAIDVGLNAGQWRAPSSGTITSSQASVPCVIGGTNYGVSLGGIVVFEDTNGNRYRMLHVTPMRGTGTVTKGTPIAQIDLSVPRSPCWSGPHYHLEVLTAGGHVNTLDWYNNKLSCAVGFCPE